MTAVRTRMHPTDRADAILAAAVKLAKRIGFRRITRDGVAKAAGVSGGLVTAYFDNFDGLREAVMREAVRSELLGIVAEGIVEGNAVAKRAPRELRMRAMQSLAS